MLARERKREKREERREKREEREREEKREERREKRRERVCVEREKLHHERLMKSNKPMPLFLLLSIP
jgi:hypothetical protein